MAERDHDKDRTGGHAGAMFIAGSLAIFLVIAISVVYCVARVVF